MATRIIATGDFSDYSSRRVTIEVIGGCHSKMMRVAKYTKTIPYSSLSQTIQSIHRLGGKITHITLSPSHTEVSKIEFVEPLSKIAESDVLPSANQAESITSSPLPQKQDNSEDIRQETKPTKAKQEQQPITVFNPGEYTFTEEW
ncbi:MAG: hypothetical protein KME54_26285 [Tolypothrix brevis GSE-NOS-MK-07-07A]|jgi:hypothetical protein|nr:hypothetical protein [Tolypothrix brevis GSE-NOS-MK-07-07A]